MTNESNTIHLAIPFDGFYGTMHEAALDDAFEIECDINEMPLEVAQELSCEINWQSLREAYASDFADYWHSYMPLEHFKFDRLHSPREYNFHNDQIICEFDRDELKALWLETFNDGAALAEFTQLVKYRLEPREGFAPFYSNELADWGKFEEWEEPQIELFLEHYTDYETAFDQLGMDYNCDGEFWAYGVETSERALELIAPYID